MPVQQASDSGSGHGGHQARGTPPSPPTGPPVHAPFWNEPMVRDYIKQASQHGQKRRDPPNGSGHGGKLPEIAPPSNGQPARGVGNNNADGHRREYVRVMSDTAQTAGCSAGGAAAPHAAAAYDPDAAPRIRTVKMRGPQARTSLDGPLRR